MPYPVQAVIKMRITLPEVSAWLLAVVLPLTGFIGGCALLPGTLPSGQTMPSTPPSLSEEARQALARADADIERAKAAHALWTTAAAAHEAAHEAARIGDSLKVVVEARSASELARLGLAQKDYPTTEK